MNERCQLTVQKRLQTEASVHWYQVCKDTLGRIIKHHRQQASRVYSNEQQGWAEPGALSIRVRTWTSIVSARTLELPNCPEPDHKCMMRRVYLGLEAPRCLHVPAVAWSRQPVQTWRGAPPVDLASPSICSFGSLYYRYTATLSRLICLWTLQRTP